MAEEPMQIIVSEQVGLLLRTLSKLTNMTNDQIILKALKLDGLNLGEPANSPPSPAAGDGATFRTREASLPVGMRLRKVFKGQERGATVEQHGIRIEGENRVFLSPSLAAVAVTGYNTNGWTFWDYWDEKTQNWRPLDDLRRDSIRSDSSGCTIAVFNSSSFGAELGICDEWKDGPSRHAAVYVVSNPHWRRSRAFCREHLEKCADKEPILRAAWDLFKEDMERANRDFHSSSKS